MYIYTLKILCFSLPKIYHPFVAYKRRSVIKSQHIPLSNSAVNCPDLMDLHAMTKSLAVFYVVTHSSMESEDIV